MATPTPPQPESILSPLLASLPAASVAPSPPTALLPLLSPILRQRVQLLSGASSDPWLPLLCYDSAKATQLESIARDERLEPHPVSGEVEIDWETEARIQYKRVDEETLQAEVCLEELGLGVRLVWCVNDEAGGRDGWRIGEAAALDGSEATWGVDSLATAEDVFKQTSATVASTQSLKGGADRRPALAVEGEQQEDDEEDDYWAQYDRTPGKGTPVQHQNISMTVPKTSTSPADEDSYFAQYGSVQPAMDDQDPDEAEQNGNVESTLGQDEISRELQLALASGNLPHSDHSSMTWLESPVDSNDIHKNQISALVHPRPESSTGSSRSRTVEKLEMQVATGEQSEVGIKQHISTSVKSLWRLAKVAGIEMDEFDRLIRTELDCLSLVESEVWS